MKVNWATSPGNQPKQDTSSKYTQFSDFSSLHEKKKLSSVVRFAFDPCPNCGQRTNWLEQRITTRERLFKAAPPQRERDESCRNYATRLMQKHEEIFVKR